MVRGSADNRDIPSRHAWRARLKGGRLGVRPRENPGVRHEHASDLDDGVARRAASGGGWLVASRADYPLDGSQLVPPGAANVASCANVLTICRHTRYAVTVVGEYPQRGPPDLATTVPLAVRTGNGPARASK